MCKHQDKKGGSLAKEKLFCSGIGMQFLNMEQTYYIVRSKAEDNEHILYLPLKQLEAVRKIVINEKVSLSEEDWISVIGHKSLRQFEVRWDGMEGVEPSF